MGTTSAPGAAQILIVDDFDDALDIYGQYLEFVGYRVLTARNGTDAINLARRHRPDLILLDISMPGLNGFDVVWILRRDPAFLHTPIVALTARALDSERAEALRGGFDTVIAKPCLPDALAAHVETILRTLATGPRVLLATDIDDQAVRYQDALHRAGFRVKWTRTGADTLDVAQRFLPACVVIDLRLPDGPGWDVCKQLKSHEALKDLRIVVLTHDLNPDTAHHSSSIGCHAWLAHPATAEDLRHTVELALGRDGNRPASIEDALVGVVECPGCQSTKVQAGVRVAAIQYYCCKTCRLCWRVDRALALA
jgi:DNA-binding response OmpR family regulator